MFALPVYIRHGTELRCLDGTLQKLPSELTIPNQLNFYSHRCRLGWTRCPRGYWVFVSNLELDTDLIIPGLIVHGRQKPSKRYYAFPREYDESQILEFSESVKRYYESIEKEVSRILSSLTHDIRALSGNIYNAAIEAKRFIGVDFQSTENRLDTVLAAQGMLSYRIDLVDYMSSGGDFDQSVRFIAYRKVDKVVRCFRPKALQKNCAIDLTGQSFSESFGPPIFDLAIYPIIDNAVKYAPAGTKISVRVLEIDKKVQIEVFSLGPRINVEEKEKIFLKNYRSSAARKSVAAGSGEGLSMAKGLIEQQFYGSIIVDQDDQFSSNGGGEFFGTRFTVNIPIIE